MYSGELQRQEDPVTVFMGVPTMYAYLLSAYEAMDQAQKEAARAAARRLRLTVCGSAPCPAPVYRAWEQLAGAPAAPAGLGQGRPAWLCLVCAACVGHVGALSAALLLM